ncbi:MAG TPA: CBS domain-containing protein, partial [Acidobacteriota bacterium]|nr:CBS domain-containing protein [Acidobacteriota bacterium]
MEIIQAVWLQTFWYALTFVLCIWSYLSFSLISQDVVATAAAGPLDPKQLYSLPPLSRLCPDMERLTAILNFSRLLFVIPVLLLAYRWTVRFGAIPVVVVLTCLILLLYLLPEWMLRRKSPSVFKSTVQIIGYILYPLFWLLSRLTPIDAREPDAQEKKHEEADEEESKEFKGDILKAISMIGETTVREVMTPRVDMVAIASTATLSDLHQMFKEHKFSRLPVYKEKVDNIIGIVSVMDLVSSVPKQDMTTPVTHLMRPAIFVPETKKVFTLLRELREAHSQMAIVIDEYGGTSGLVTLEDLLEEIVGEIGDEHDEAPFEHFKDREGSIIVTGKFPI